jgi:transaldolase
LNRIQNLHNLGQSLWYDNIQRSLLTSGELAKLINAGDIRGVTSNPSIFYHAISQSHDYDAAMLPLAKTGAGDEEIFYNLAVEDICSAADLFLPLYQKTRGGDGYVSLEVSPRLANDTLATIQDARRIWSLVSRPNLMVKIPATPAGLPAIKAALAEGMNINVTLIFSLERYQQVIEAYLAGLEERTSRGQPINHVASVASFFVSRLDTKVDAALTKIATPQAASLAGRAAIANARLAYQLFESKFTSERFKSLQKAGAKVQRPLWASTSTKNPVYRDVIYIEELIGPNTVNTAPPKTIDAFRDHGIARLSLQKETGQSQHIIDMLEELGISLKSINQELEIEGVRAFSDAYSALIKSIADKRNLMLAQKSK